MLMAGVIFVLNACSLARKRCPFVYLIGHELPVWPMNVKIDFIKNNTQLRWNIKHM